VPAARPALRADAARRDTWRRAGAMGRRLRSPRARGPTFRGRNPDGCCSQMHLVLVSFVGCCAGDHPCERPDREAIAEEHGLGPLPGRGREGRRAALRKNGRPLLGVQPQRRRTNREREAHQEPAARHERHGPAARTSEPAARRAGVAPGRILRASTPSPGYRPASRTHTSMRAGSSTAARRRRCRTRRRAPPRPPRKR